MNEGDHWQWRNFAVLPVTRLPTNSLAIRDNVIQFDEENFANIFARSFFNIRHLPFDSIGELYFFQLSESDTANVPTRDRNLSTPGFRWYRIPKVNVFDFELELALQTGSSHAGRAATDTTNLEHFAYFGHVAIGYIFDLPWHPQLLLQYDYASGDADPFDRKNRHFDTLFGARRFEFGPTGIWGAFARTNINTPGIRVLFRHMPKISGFIAHRAFWLAEKRDTWVGSNLRDITGRSGSFIGQQLEARLRWEAIPGMLRLEKPVGLICSRVRLPGTPPTRRPTRAMRAISMCRPLFRFDRRGSSRALRPTAFVSRTLSENSDRSEGKTDWRSRLVYSRTAS